jgi:DNA-binding protein HU-beta
MASKTKTAAKKSAGKAGGKATSLTLKQIAATLAERHEIPKVQSNALTSELFDIVAKELKRGTKIRVPGFGIFAVAHRAARMGRNPATGEAIKIKASKKVRFRVAKELKESI